MLVLTRKVGDVVTIGDDIKVVVVAINGKQVRIGIEADRSTAIHRGEIYQKIKNDLEAPTVQSLALEESQSSESLLSTPMAPPVSGLKQAEKKTIIIRKKVFNDKSSAEVN